MYECAPAAARWHIPAIPLGCRPHSQTKSGHLATASHPGPPPLLFLSQTQRFLCHSCKTCTKIWMCSHESLDNWLISKFCATHLLPTMPNPTLWPGSKFKSTLKRSHMSSGVWFCCVCVVWFWCVSVTGSLYIHSRTRCGLKRRTLKASSWVAILRSMPFTLKKVQWLVESRSKNLGKKY